MDAPGHVRSVNRIADLYFRAATRQYDSVSQLR
jgi:hypothetical protein